jgi:signal transduction histidine kinase/DNA-binding response OmpR family regulator/PAS domain-containing protein
MGKIIRGIFWRVGMALALLLFPVMECLAAAEEIPHAHDVGHIAIFLIASVPAIVTALVLTFVLLRTRRRHSDQLEALHNAQESFHALVDENPNIAIMFDDALRFIDCNRAFMDIYDFETKEEALANFYAVVPPSILPVQKNGRPAVPITERLKIALKDGSTSSESILRVKGENLYLDIFYKRIPYRGSYAVVCYTNNTTALREEQDKLSTLAKTIGLSGAYVWEIDVKDRIFRQVANDTDWLGIQKDYIQGPLDVIIPTLTYEGDMHLAGSVVNPYLAGSGEKPFSFICRLRNFVQGGLTWVRVLGFADEFDEDGKIVRVIGSVINIDDQMREITAYTADREKRRMLFDSVYKALDPAIVFLPDGEMIVNEAFYGAFPGWQHIYQPGVGIDDAVIEFWKTLITNIDEVLAQSDRLRETRKSQEVVWHFRNGTDLLFKADIVEFGNGESLECWISRDITELSKTKLMFNEVFNVMDPAVAILSDGTMIANDAYSVVFPNWEDIYNNALSGDDEKDFATLVDYWDSMITNADEHITAITKIRGTHEAVECIWHFRDGKECIQKGYWLETGKVSGELWVLTDVTDLYNAMQKANEASRAKSMFLSSISHEIRTPMNAIIGLTLLARKTHDAAKSQRYLKRIEEAGHRLMTLINDVLDMSKIESGKMEISENEFDYIRTCEHAVNAISDQAHEKHITLNTVFNATFSHLMWADELRLSQVLLNLLSNAVKFTSEGGSITVTTDVFDDHILRVSCADNGIGISEEDLPKLFNKFEQADKSITRQYGGTGLGLAICKQIIDLMGGIIYVNSVPGQGSVFTFEIPFEWRGPVIAPNSVVTALESTRVLVVDDEPSITEYFVEVLKEYYINADTAKDGLEALEMAQRAMDAERPYNIAFLDWKMPRLSGAETALRLYDLCPACKIIIISNSDWVDIRGTFSDHLLDGIIEYMPKPVPPSDIYNRIVKTLNIDVTFSNILDFSEKRILLVEDVEVNRLIVTAMLEDTGCIIDEAENGQVGVDMARAADYDLILMDMQMPVMDGLTATRAIRLFNADVPIIAMTANAFKEDAEACLRAGMNAHLAKPIDNDSFMRLLTEYLANSGKNLAEVQG